MSTSDDDSQQRFALGFLFALIALVVSTVVGVVVYQRGIKSPEATIIEVPVQGVIVIDEALVRVDNGVVKFFFATGKADVAIGGNEALADVVRGVMNGKHARISGFHDATGDAAANIELAKQRALAVQATLFALGVDKDMVELKKPESSQASGSNAEARRVEVVLID
ncbi:OmpA family protein [Acidovorax sp. Be4]|uniref:OmpA family protein n=1 Tax=Acidovorax bellezanensis TaxID=2976702 RepID=A0ABT2PLT4_9BURK|nr:OmpA family protein [Acidovorax sp. Be4]MCT9810187.1 OmpA family protein [Acidovorax sp. Be4]